MKGDRPLDSVAAVLGVLGVVAGILEIFYRPFRIGPIGLLFVLVALIISSNHRRLTAAATVAVGIGFMIGAAIAVWDSNPLY